MFKTIMHNMKIGKDKNPSPKNTAQPNNNKKDKGGSNNSNPVPNNSQLLTLHQQQQYQQQQQQQMLKQENDRNQMKNQQQQQQQQQPQQPQHNQQQSNQKNAQMIINSLNPQQQRNLQAMQQNQIVQHFANLQLQQQQQQNQRLSQSSTLSNLNPNQQQSNHQTGTLPRQMTNGGQNSISNSLSTSAINGNILNGNPLLNESNPAARQIITNGNAIYGRTIAVQQQPNQGVYNSSTLGKQPTMISNLNKSNSIYGQTQLNASQQQQLNNQLIYASRQNPNLFKVNPQAHTIYGQTTNGQQQQQFNNSQLNLSQNQLMNNRLSLFEDDPGIMSEVETASTGFRRMNKIRASLPIVRTMSKSSDRSLGLVFLQFKNETKKSLLPNEITSFDTVKALFVRSFPNLLTMDYFEDKNRVRIYVHDQKRDMFYELEDLKDVKDRSILRVYENHNGVWLPAGLNNVVNNSNNSALNSSANSNLSSGLQRPNSIMGFSNKKDELNYFSEPEFDNDFNQHNNLHKKRFSASFANNYGQQGANLINVGNNSQYYGTIVVSAQQRQEVLAKQQQMNHHISSTLPRGTHLMNINNQLSTAQQQAPPKPQRTFNMINQSNDKQQLLLNNKISFINGNPLQQSLNSTNSSLFDKSSLGQDIQRPFSVAGNYSIEQQFGLPIQMARSFHETGMPSAAAQFLTSPERKQLNLLQQQQQSSDIYGFNGQTHLDDQTNLKMKMMEKQLENLTGIVETVLKPTINQQQQQPHGQSNIMKPKKQNLSFDLAINGNMMNSICTIQNKVGILRNDLKELRKFTLDQRQMFTVFMNQVANELKNRLSLFELQDKKVQNFRFKRLRLTKEEEVYREDVGKLEKDLTELELNVEKLRANVISRRCRVNMIDVENMALSLSRAGRIVSELKSKFPDLQTNLKMIMTKEMQVVVDEEKFLKEEPDRLENALKRCKKLTGTLVTLKRLASVQEQRSSANKGALEKCLSTDSNIDQDGSKNPSISIQLTPATPTLINNCKPENVLDNLLDELQTFTNTNNLNRSNSGESDQLQRNQPQRKSLDSKKKSVPAPPPRSSSSKLTDRNDSINKSQEIEENGVCKQGVTRSNSEPSSKQSSNYRPKSTPPENGELDIRVDGIDTHSVNLHSISNKLLMMDNLLSLMPSTSTNSLSSVGSQDSVVDGGSGMAARKSRQQILEERHQDLLKKQKRLQEQYIKLQQLSRVELPKNILNELKKTGSESNILNHMMMKAAASAVKNQVPNKNGLNMNCSVQNGYHESTKNASLNATSLSSPNKQASKQASFSNHKSSERIDTNTSSTDTQKLFESSII